jgi:hypothetical protein
VNRASVSAEPLRLVCHPSIGITPVRAITASLRVQDGSREGDTQSLVATWRLEAELDALRIPARVRPCTADDLWRHTCFELFVRRGRETAYREVNVSPSSAWALYAFEGYRAGMQPVEPLRAVPSIELHYDSRVLALTAHLPFDLIAERDATGRRSRDDELRLNVAAVIEDRHGTLSYWALTHPDPLRPDFHHPDGFVHEIRHRPARK